MTTITEIDTPADRRHFTGVTQLDDGSGTQSVRTTADDGGLNEVEEGRHLMERFYERYSKTAQVDLVFVLDRSGSVPQKGWRSVVEFVKVSVEFVVGQTQCCSNSIGSICCTVTTLLICKLLK